MMVRLRYHVPLDVVVDTGTGQVTSVTLIEEEMLPIGWAYDHGTGTMLPRTSSQHQLALAMAKISEWPMWEFKED